MAKLNGVKTLDMVNGEITKVAYGGAAYVKSEGLPKMGDLVLAQKCGYDITYGAFYKITEDADHEEDVRFLDDVDDGRVRDTNDYVLFRKVSTGTNPSLEERVSSAEDEIESLKSDVAALMGESEYVRIDVAKAQDGDYVKFDEAPRRYLTAGRYYEIDYVDSSGDPWITDDDGDDFDTSVLHDDEFEVYRKVSAASLEVEPKPERLKVGDYAKVVDLGENRIRFGGSIGDIVKVADVRKTQIRTVELDGGYYNGNPWAEPSQLVRATDEEVAEAKDAVARAKFKKGAKVRLLSGGGRHPLCGLTDGKIYEVVNNNFDHPNGKRIQIEDGFATPDQLEILSEEEAAEIERKQAEEAKWTKIGRKVGEYKKGDVVQLSDHNRKLGVMDYIGVHFYGVELPNGDYARPDKDRVTLITPVEARFDR
ncbi:hypothetical protein [Bacillus amyloliquefaciens]|uniref:hypothetical protein n=1 Tax=Bacillus amyloliquefaciens TaxID=1390 RepID=UPI00197AFE73|nr:hypothetical protein [Bacillus amyloliquefaciens]